MTGHCVLSTMKVVFQDKKLEKRKMKIFSIMLEKYELVSMISPGQGDVPKPMRLHELCARACVC